MASNSQSRLGGDGNTGTGQQRQSRVSEIAASHHRRNDDSWVELASQPSSSSLSSIGDEIVTTGLRVGNPSYPPRRRRLQPAQHHMPSTYIVSHAAAQAGTSSQEEYDETESEEDHMLTSSTEQLSPSARALPRQPTTTIPPATATHTDSGSDDENSTALGVGRQHSGRPSSSPTFRPQPNAFSHPPSHLARHSTSSAIPQHPPHPSSRPTMAQRAHTRPNRGGAPNFMDPTYQADNDAALRASLTTLLSCARALPKKDPVVAAAGPPAALSNQPLNLRFAPESELMGPPPPAIPTHLRPPPHTASNSSAPSAPSSTSSRSHDPPPTTTDKPKRAATPTSRAKSPRAAKKKRTSSSDVAGSEAGMSPTVLTWVVSAGVLVLVSAVGFGAGYVIGREVGRQEGASVVGGMGLGGGGQVGNVTGCGREVVRSGSGGTLRRFKWGVGRSVVA